MIIRKKSIFTAFAVLAILAPLSVSSAALIELEPNDTFVTAQSISVPPALADAGIWTFASDTDVDWFTTTIPAQSVFTVNTAPIGTPFTDPDTEIFLVDAGGVVLAQNDDGGQGLGSNFSYETGGVSELLYVAITGFSDAGFIVGSGIGDIDGFDSSGAPHGETGPYVLTVSAVTVPEPMTWVLLAFGLLGLAFARR